ncbi:MAG: alanine--tRNA ligase-related protein, partial [Chloroflexi bacterium]|nr:alanine--tRNA ligase-related protein [Chloroflexota bacterium]
MPGPSARTVPLFHEDAYLRTFNTVVAAVEDDLLVLEESAFYPRGGGQPPDQGIIEFDGTTSRVASVSRKGAA